MFAAAHVWALFLLGRLLVMISFRFHAFVFVCLYAAFTHWEHLLAPQYACPPKTGRSKFTNVQAKDGSFAVQCLVCKNNFASMEVAQHHAKLTGHAEFGQVAPMR